MVEHPTFMYRKDENFTSVSLTWWKAGEQYAVSTNVPVTLNPKETMGKMLAAHQWCLDEFVYQAMNRGKK